MSDVMGGLVRRFQLAALRERYDTTLVLGTFALLNGFPSIAVMAAAAVVTDQPFVFPSLGPTAFLLFYTPQQASASPRNTVLGHLVGVIAGYLALVVFGLTVAGPALAEGSARHGSSRPRSRWASRPASWSGCASRIRRPARRRSSSASGSSLSPASWPCSCWPSCCSSPRGS